MEIIPQCSPAASYLAHKNEIDNAVQKVLNSGWYILGQEVETFENNFAAWNGTKYCVGVGSGTDALILALKALDIKPGEGVISVSHTAVATIAAIEAVGAIPILLDIDPDNFNMDVNQLKDFLNQYPSIYEGIKIKAIIPVHLYGNPCDMNSIRKITGKYGLKIIEDCAQAHGAEINGIKVGNFGDIAAFSFYPTKNLGAFGDGGTVIMNDESLYKKTVSLRQYGWKERYISEIPGLNSRLDELQAAILNIKIKYLGYEIKKRNEIAKSYTRDLKEYIIKPNVDRNAIHAFHLYVIKHRSRDGLMKYLSENRILTSIHYPIPVHLQPAYKDRLPIPFGLPNTETAVKEILSLPLFPELNHNNVVKIIGTINSFK